MAVVRAWRCKEVQITLPIGAVRGMFERARKWGLTEGGRFDARGDSIFLWSTPSRAPEARPIGAFSVRWGAPKARQATIELIAWDRSAADAVDQLCRGVELLAGALVHR